MRGDYLWHAHARLGVCGGSVVASPVDRVHRSAVDMAQAAAESSDFRGGRGGSIMVDKAFGPLSGLQL